jgi:GNAT superfamily N-acetyltransferase
MTANTVEGVTISSAPTEQEVNLVQAKLYDFCQDQTGAEYGRPGIEISLVLKDSQGNVVGGIGASTVMRVMFLEVLWVANEHRKMGYGTDLVLAAERIGLEQGCITSQTWSLSFQAPGFYQKIGYQVLGVYDGYSDGITETVLMKRLQSDRGAPPNRSRDSRRFAVSKPESKEEMDVVHAGLGGYVDECIGSKRDGIKVQLVVRDQAGQLVGGLLGFTTMGNLILEAEQIAVQNGCTACQTYALSFQSPGFFRRMGYEEFGVSDGFPAPVQEHYLIKRLKPG